MSVVLALACAVAPAGAAPGARPEVTITLVTHDSYNVSKSVIASFTRNTGIHVKVLHGGDAGQTVNQAILTKDHPLGDVLYGVDNTFLSRTLDARIFDAYRSPALDHVPARYVLDPRHRVTPVDRADVCVNDDKQWLADHQLPAPATLEDLAKPRYKGMLVVENPATSSTGLAFLLATIAHFGNDGWRDYWTRLRANDVKVVDGWEQAWYDRFTAGSSHGDHPLVASYASSPPATVNKKTGKAQAGTLLATCFQQIEFVGVLHGTSHRSAARAFVDFMLSKAFQQDMPDQMYVFPVLDGAKLPPDFAKFAEVAKSPLFVAPARVAKNRDTWIREWTETVLR
jgi:thiamine transport system substrate-binding protein